MVPHLDGRKHCPLVNLLDHPVKCEWRKPGLAMFTMTLKVFITKR